MPRARSPNPSVLDCTVLLSDVAIDDAHIIIATCEYGDSPLLGIHEDGACRRDLLSGAAPKVSRVIADANGIVIAGDRGVGWFVRGRSATALCLHVRGLLFVAGRMLQKRTTIGDVRALASVRNRRFATPCAR
jgi:hypothetical protein